VPFVDNWHVGALCEHLQAVTTGQIDRLVVNVPPGLGKSLLTCVFWPAWEWALDPGVRWFFASYDQRLSTRDAVRCRALLSRPWYRGRCARPFRLTGDQNQKTYYETDRGGYRLATSTGGHASGEHPDRIVCDDPHNVQQAESATERQAVLDWWDLTMSTRGVSRRARRVLIMQRLHQDDLAGHVLAEGGWVHLCLPMRFEPDRMPVTPLGWTDPRQEDGTLLCPQQFGETAVAGMEKALGAYGTAGQLQQRPVPREGGMFKRSYFNQRVKAAPYHARRVRYWDRAATQDGGCYTVGTLLARCDQGNWYVEHVVHGQWEPDRRDEQIVAAARRDRLRYGQGREPTIYIEHEPGSSGVDAYKHTARKLADFRVFPDRPTGAKEVRAEPWASQCAAKNVYLVENGSWDIAGWVDEHCHFPLGKYKDRVDSASGAFARLARSHPPVPALRVLPLRQWHHRRTLHIVVCTPEQFAAAPVEPLSPVISIRDPLPVGQTQEPDAAPPEVPGTLTLRFADLDPADLQEGWGQEVPPYGRPAEQLVMTREIGKKLWSFLLRGGGPRTRTIVVQDDRGRRALSVAYAIADVLRLSRSHGIYVMGREETELPANDPPPNRHIYETAKRSREMVI
jgi:predicted phage terminase large subunit-like protein